MFIECVKKLWELFQTLTHFFKMAASLSPTGLSSQAPTYWCSATDRDLNILPLNLQQREWRAIEKKKKSDKEKLKSFFLYIGSACEWAMCCELMVVIIWVSLWNIHGHSGRTKVRYLPEFCESLILQAFHSATLTVVQHWFKPLLSQ